VSDVILSMMASVDGYFEGPNGELDWHQVDEEVHQFFNDELRVMGAFLEGRRAYELMETYWPTADEDPDAPATMAEFAGIWRATPKVVFSRTLQQTGPNATLVREVTRDGVEALKSRFDGDLVVGGAELAAEFGRQGLIDQVWLYVNPVILGGGNRMFGDWDFRLDLELTQTRAFSNGVAMLRYRRSQ
jgi:dihydrofolate reductase